MKTKLVDGSYSHSIAIAGGTLFSWGGEGLGEKAQKTAAQVLIPVESRMLRNWRQNACGAACGKHFTVIVSGELIGFVSAMDFFCNGRKLSHVGQYRGNQEMKSDILVVTV